MTAHFAVLVWDTQVGLLSSHRSMILSMKLITGYLYCYGCHHQFFRDFTRSGLRKTRTDALEEGFQLVSLWA